MHGHEVCQLEELKSRLQAVQKGSGRLVAIRDQLEGELAQRRTELDKLMRRQEVLSKVLELYRSLLDALVLDQVRLLESIVSEGLASIFYDQGLSFKLELGSRYNKVVADPFICQGDIKGHPLDSFGGGPASIVSLILRVVVLLRMKRHKLLLLDETLAAVSDEYIELTGQFLSKLSGSSGLPILLVTHKQSFLEHATSGYQGDSKVEGDGLEFVVRKIRGRHEK